MRRIGIYALIICGLFYFSEGKPCPERTRPHKTRCEAFFKCLELPTQTHVWVPEKCEQGLIYEPNLRMCVLPADDWECTLGDRTPPNDKDSKQSERNEQERIKSAAIAEAAKKSKDSDIYIVSSEDSLDDDDDGDQFMAKDHKDSDKVELIVDANMGGDDAANDENPYESSGDGGDLMVDDGFLQTENRETEDSMQEHAKQPKDVAVEELPTSTTTATSSSPSPIDPSLTAHLQRLSQLIDGLKKTYQNKEQAQTELRPDQLNAFLAHFNIKNKFESLGTENDDFKMTPITITTPMPPSMPPTVTVIASKNKTALQAHLNKLKPETKVVLMNQPPKHYTNGGYSNSQIVVNRPEGSVLFSLPPYGGGEANFNEHSAEYVPHNSPKISEETLKTVLELSKQMIANQNMPKVVQNPAYYPQPIIQPVYLPPQNFHGHNSPFSSYYNGNNNNNQNEVDYEDNNNGDKYGSYSRPRPHHQQHGHRPPSNANRPSGNGGSGGGGGGGSGYGKPSATTIIHNNVIPVHVTTSGSGEKEVVDSYGQSLGLYPPLNVEEQSNGYTGQAINHHQHHAHRYENNKFMTTVTTVRPTTPSNHYTGQYPSPYPSDMSATTMRPIEYSPTSATLANYYTPSPHLSEHNANNLFQTGGGDRYPSMQYGNMPRPFESNRPGASGGGGSGGGYPQMERPNQQPQYGSQLFPPQIDANRVKIRPNAQKIESMEIEADELGTSGGGGGGGSEDNYDDQSQSQQHHVLTYSYSSERPIDVSGQLALQILSNSGQKRRPYMPRPSAPSASYSTASSGNGGYSNTPKFPAFGAQSPSGGVSGTQLVNVGGNFISYDVFRNTLLPLMGGGSQLAPNVEVITCTAGVRQPNATDCTRYYVCSKKDGKVLSYACPPYTAFNAQTRICDARTYSECSTDAIVSSYTVAENKRKHLEALELMQEANRRREQALKLQQQQQQQQLQQQFATSGVGGGTSGERDMLQAYIQQAASMASMATMVSSTARPSPASQPVKKRKYYCKEGDKVPDQTSINTYFVCYKNGQGQMRGHKMTCSKGLIFCPKTTMCTLASKCA